MAQTDLNICNRAISLVGAELIEAIDDTSPIGLFCQVNYTPKKRGLIARHRWVFATKVAQLSRIDDADVAQMPARPAGSAFLKPSDLVGIIHAFRDRAMIDGSCAVRAIEIGGHYWADAPVMWAEYTASRDEHEWPEWFSDLVVTAFAADLARYLQNRSLANDFEMRAFGTPSENGEGGLYASARSEDARGAPQRQLFGWDGGELISARFSSGHVGTSVSGTFIDF